MLCSCWSGLKAKYALTADVSLSVVCCPSRVVNRVRPSQPVDNTRRAFCSQHQWYDAKSGTGCGTAFYRIGDILVCLCRKSQPAHGPKVCV